MIYFFIVVAIAFLVVYFYIKDELRNSKQNTKKEKLVQGYEEALEKFKSEGLYNFKISMVYSGEYLLFYINSSGDISIYVAKDGEYKEVEFSNNDGGRALRENIKNIFIGVAFTKKFKITPKMYEKLSGDVTVKYEDDDKIYRTVWQNPSSDSDRPRELSEIEKLCNSFKLPKNSSFDDFKKKYRQLCKKYHPDVYGSDDVMKKINIVYERVEIYFGKK